MREIKFRAWDKNRKKMWSHSDLYKMDCSNEYPFLALIRGFYATNMFPGEEMDVIPMQFTGLKDRNGKEIYEGDILRHPPKNEWEEKNFVAFEVFYHDNNNADNHVGFQMNRLHFHGAYAGYYMTEKFLPRYTEGMIVIGNIYENPELLEGTV